MLTSEDGGSPSAVIDRGHNESRGRRLTEAFESLQVFPALTESRNRLLALYDDGIPSAAEIVPVVLSDVALTVAVLRLAARVEPGLDSISRCVTALGPSTVRAMATRIPTFDFLDHRGSWRGVPEQFRRHAVMTMQVGEQLLRVTGAPDRERILAGAMLHDVGKLVLLKAYPESSSASAGASGTPEQRLATERRELGFDHAVLGGVLARRWGLPQPIARMIERHHSEDDGDAALIRLADMIAHYQVGTPVDPTTLLAAAQRIGLGPPGLRTVIHDASLADTPRAAVSAPCPLSARELDVLRLLARGLKYGQIALELGLATSTVRSHLFNTYGKLSVGDRAQAVLFATEQGWL